MRREGKADRQADRRADQPTKSSERRDRGKGRERSCGGSGLTWGMGGREGGRRRGETG